MTGVATGIGILDVVCVCTFRWAWFDWTDVDDGLKFDVLFDEAKVKD